MERSDQPYILYCDGLPIFHGSFLECLTLRNSLLDVDGMECFSFALRKGDYHA